MSRLVGALFLLVSIGIAATAVHVRGERPSVDYRGLQACIAHAERTHPVADRHQELVNALYTCGVYRAGPANGALVPPPSLLASNT
jgi:hypothetical protein